LEAISRDEIASKSINTHTKVSKALDGIKENFPRISKETLEKLSTVEGIKNRAEIINSIPDSELLPNIDKTLNDYSEKEQEIIKEIVTSTKNLDSTNVIDLIKEKFPDYNESTYRQSFLNAMVEEIASGKTDSEKESIKTDIINADLSEIENLRDRSDLKALKNAVNENYTVGSIMNEIKTKASSIKLKEIIDKSKKLENLDDVSLFNLKVEAENTTPDILIANLLELPTQGDNSYINDLLDRSVKYNVDKILDENPGIRKNKVVEKLLEQNPEHKDKILYFMKETYSKRIEDISSNLNEKQNKRLLKILAKEDLEDLQLLKENRSIDQIKAVTIINSSHNSLLHDIKHKASLRSIKSKEDNPNLSSTAHLDDTMNLFD
jgi:hypothetical protein